MTTTIKKTIGVWSPAGGVGRTFTSIALARALSKKGLRVAILDFDLRTPMLAAYFRSDDMSHGLDNLLPFAAGGNLTAEILEANLQVSQDIHYLRGTLAPDQAPNVEQAPLKSVLDVAKGIFDHVIVDTGTIIDNFGVYVALAETDQVLYLVTPNALTVQHYDVVRSSVHQHFHPEAFQLVVNRTSKDVPIEVQDIEEYLEMRDALALPDLGHEFTQALNTGKWQTYLDSVKAKPYTDAMEELAARTVRPGLNELASAKKGFSLFGLHMKR